jgi:hypothetical protein
MPIFCGMGLRLRAFFELSQPRWQPEYLYFIARRCHRCLYPHPELATLATQVLRPLRLFPQFLIVFSWVLPPPLLLVLQRANLCLGAFPLACLQKFVCWCSSRPRPWNLLVRLWGVKLLFLSGGGGGLISSHLASKLLLTSTYNHLPWCPSVPLRLRMSSRFLVCQVHMAPWSVPHHKF